MTQSNEQVDSESPNGVARDVRRSPYGELLNLARSAPARHGFWVAALASIGEYFDSPYSALHLAWGSENDFGRASSGRERSTVLGRAGGGISDGRSRRAAIRGRSY